MVSYFMSYFEFLKKLVFVKEMIPFHILPIFLFVILYFILNSDSVKKKKYAITAVSVAAVIFIGSLTYIGLDGLAECAECNNFSWGDRIFTSGFPWSDLSFHMFTVMIDVISLYFMSAHIVLLFVLAFLLFRYEDKKWIITVCVLEVISLVPVILIVTTNKTP